MIEAFNFGAPELLVVFILIVALVALWVRNSYRKA